MAFDGSAYDGYTGEPNRRLLRPATVEQAVARYSLFVLRLKQGSLELSFSQPSEGPEVVRARRPGRVEERWVMLRRDFDLCKHAAGAVDTSLFRTDSQSDVLSRIAAQLRVLFG